MFFLIAAAVVRVYGQSVPAGEPSVADVILEAGNAGDDGVRLDILKQLRERPGIGDALKTDLNKLIGEIDLWLREPNLEYFRPRMTRSGGDYPFGIAESSPLYPLTFVYRGRMLAWYALEFGRIWAVAEERRVYLERIRAMFEKAVAHFPNDRIARMYLGYPLPAPRKYASVPGAPQWAACQREGLERLTDIIEWWIDHRMRPDGQYGGGWGDDCEMWRWWVPVLIAFESPKVVDAQARFSAAIMSQPHMKLGYTTQMVDVEHTAEDSADAITPMMHLAPEDDAWRRRALRIAELMENLWTGRNQRGLLQFKSTYFTAEKVDPTSQRACDTVYHPRAVQPALLYWQRTGDVRLTRLFTAWMDTWVDATARAERGKPAGVVPSAIHWPDGRVGGDGPDWWDPRNHGEYTLYLWPSAMGQMLNSLLLAHHMTGDAKYLEPIRSMARIRAKYLAAGKVEAAPAGSEMWCAARMGEFPEWADLSGTLAKYRFLTGNHEFDGLLEREKSSYMRYRLRSDVEPLAADLRDNAEALSINFEGYTSEVRYTDRVLRFPAMFGRHGIPGLGGVKIREPNPHLLYATATGDPGDLGYFPMNAVRWLTPPREIAAMVDSASPDSFKATLFHFGAAPRVMAAEFYLLRPGRYVLTLTAAEGAGAARTSGAQGLVVEGRSARTSFTLPPQRLCVLRVERE